MAASSPQPADTLMQDLTPTPTPTLVETDTPIACPEIVLTDPPLDVFDSSETTDPPCPIMGFTENCSATYLSSGNPCLDFFFHILPDTPKESLMERLQAAWKSNSLTALKLIAHLRGVRGTGKSDKESFYTAALWLHEHHPKTLALNVKWFAEFGYLKDLLEILYRLLEGLEVRKNIKEEREKSSIYWTRGKRTVKTQPIVVYRKGKRVVEERKVLNTKRNPNLKQKKGVRKIPEGVLQDLVAKKLEGLNVEDKKREKKKKEKKENYMAPRDLKKKKIADAARKAQERYDNDPKYRFLHDTVADHFAELLVSDITHLRSHKYKNISLASKWCPSLDSSYDRSMLICASIAKRVFPRDSNPEYKELEEAHYVFRVRDRLRKEVLVPLHQALELPEVYMSAKKWNELPYRRVASVAMKLYKTRFFEHDTERFGEFIENVKQGKAKIAAGALLPHEIIDSLEDSEENETKDVAELQWKRMVEDLSAKEKLQNSMAICDVSGSMSGIPMKVCVALGLLISELSDGPWKGKVITFSASPTLQLVEGDTLAEKKSFVESMDWGMNTDFQKAFDLVLEVAVKAKLRPSKMIKRLFVFSDMEFDEASSNDWETDYHVIVKKFTEAGYGEAVPEIVFWNLRDSRSTPVVATQNGVALVSGYSKNLITLFLEGDGPLNPEVIMESAIYGAEYKNLNVFD